MKNTVLIILIIILVVLFGTWPLTVIGKIFELLSKAFVWLAKILNIFKWNGMLS